MLTNMPKDAEWEAWQGVLAKEDADPLEVLGAAAMYERYFAEVQNHAVKAARAQGRSWQDIGDAVGTTKQSAWQKWRSPKEQATDLTVRFVTIPGRGTGSALR